MMNTNAVEVSKVEEVQEVEEVQGFCKEAWLDKLVILLDKIEFLEEASKDKANKVDKRKLYELQQTYAMINLLLMHDQHMTDYKEPTKVTRLLKVNRYIDNYILDYKKVERVVNGGRS